MPRRGENIYKRKDNRWEGRYIKHRDSAGRAQFGYVYAKTYREAKEKLAEARLSAEQGRQKEAKVLADFCDQWLLLSRDRIKESTYVKYHNILCRHIKPELGKLTPQTLTPLMLEEFRHGLLTQGLSAKTVRDILTVLRSVWKYCRRQIGDTLPELEVDYPKPQKKPTRVLSPEEQFRFTQYLLQGEEPVRLGILLALLTGMRIGEICALQWESICLTEGTIRVEKTMQRLQTLDPAGPKKTAICVGEAKSDASQRIIPLTATAMELCRKLYCPDPKAYLLTGQKERYMEPRALQYMLKKHTDACGLEGVHFHTLRHTFATRCVEVGFEIKTLSEVLGHSSVKVTLDRYVHSSVEWKRANMEKLSAVGM